MKLESGKKYKIVDFHPYSEHHRASPHLVGAVVTCIEYQGAVPTAPGSVAFDFVTDDGKEEFTCAAYVEEINEMERESIIVSGIYIDDKFKFMAVNKVGEQYLHEDYPYYDRFWYSEGVTDPLSGIKINTKLRGEDALFKIIRHKDKIEFLQIHRKPDLKVDDILIVSDCADFEDAKWRYFSQWAEDGRVACFHRGSDSLTNTDTPVPWEYYRIPTEAEIKERRQSNQGE